MKKRRYRPSPEDYSYERLRREREYGLYWYSWLWQIARPVLVFLCVCVIVVGVLHLGWQYIDKNYVAPMEPDNTAPVTFEVKSGSSLTRVANNLEGNKRKVVAVIGDASISGGMAFEGLNNASSHPNDLLILLNDNYIVNRCRNLKTIFVFYKNYIFTLKTGNLTTTGLREKSYTITYFHIQYAILMLRNQQTTIAITQESKVMTQCVIIYLAPISLEECTYKEQQS